jgi:4a-hydroxytetrahydrobiopterin dehydratase
MADAAPSPGELAARLRVRKGTPPLDPAAVTVLRTAVPAWRVAEGKRLEREFPFRDFRTALAFADRVGEIADAEDHHPDLHVSWGKVGVVLWTHSAGGLTENDFVLAAKIDAMGV